MLPKINQLKLYQFHESTQKSELLPTAKDVNEHLMEFSSEFDKTILNKGQFKEPLLYIYTSGTTGLPKAAVITNAR